MPFARRPDARIWRDQSRTGDPVLLITGRAYGAGRRHRAAPGPAASCRVTRPGHRGAGRGSGPPGPCCPPPPSTGWHGRCFTGRAGRPAGRADDQQIIRRTRCSGRDAAASLTGAASFDPAGRPEQIRIPAPATHGTRDRIVPAASAQRLAGGTAGARLVMFPGAGHACITDLARAASQQVLHFLAGTPGPDSGSGTSPRPATSTAGT